MNYNQKIKIKKIIKPSERVGVVIQVAQRKPTTIKNFIDASLIRGKSL